MRIRTIKPEFWQHEPMSKASEFTRLLAVALLNYADDYGYFFAHPALIRGALFPFLDDSKKILGSIQDLSRLGYIKTCKDDDGRDIGIIVNFAKHQRVDKPKPSLIKGKWTIQDASKIDPRRIQDASKEEGKGREVEGEVEQGKGAGAILPFDSEEFSAVWKLWRKHRSEIRKPLKPTMEAAQLAELAAIGETRAIAAIRHTIAKGWQGIREPDARDAVKLNPIEADKARDHSGEW